MGTRSVWPVKAVYGIAGVYGACLMTALLLLSACAPTPVYRPRGPNESIGYTDQQISKNRYRITFAGGRNTRREVVEDSLLRRAAEVTVQAGYTHFVFDDRDTEARTYYRAEFDPFYDRYDWWRFGPYRPYYWSSWDGPYGGYRDIIPVTRYTAYAEIVMLTAAEAKNNPNAIPAGEVLDQLVPPAKPVR